MREHREKDDGVVVIRIFSSSNPCLQYRAEHFFIRALYAGIALGMKKRDTVKPSIASGARTSIRTYGPSLLMLCSGFRCDHHA